MRLLLHICCANCALYPVQKLKKEGAAITGLWFNPNIHPDREYLQRLGAVKTLESLWKMDVLYTGGYGLGEFLDAVGQRRSEGERCRICYRMRLHEAARTAREFGLDAFSTTLLVSPYQKFESLVEEAREAEALYDVPFYFEDFRPGYREGVRRSRELGLYRQKHCGCIFSEAERFIGRERVS
jgi:hypothetical protein